MPGAGVMVAAAVVLTKGLVSSADGVSTATSSGTRFLIALAGRSDGVAATPLANMSIASFGGLAGTSNGASTTTGALSIAARLVGSASAGASTTTGALGKVVAMSGSSAGASATSAALGRIFALASTSDGSSSTTATMREVLALVGASAGLSTATATIIVARRLAGSSNGSSTAVATLQAIVILQIYGLWNGQVFDAMQYGDKPVVAFQLTHA
jgi:hypothetical protein